MCTYKLKRNSRLQLFLVELVGELPHHARETLYSCCYIFLGCHSIYTYIAFSFLLRTFFSAVRQSIIRRIHTTIKTHSQSLLFLPIMQLANSGQIKRRKSGIGDLRPLYRWITLLGYHLPRGLTHHDLPESLSCPLGGKIRESIFIHLVSKSIQAGQHRPLLMWCISPCLAGELTPTWKIQKAPAPPKRRVDRTQEQDIYTGSYVGL